MLNIETYNMNNMDKKPLVLSGIALMTISLATIATTTILFLHPYKPTQPPKADDTGRTKQGLQEVVNANNQFAFDLYSELTKSESGNIFFSPYSISSALAMSYEGAKGQTADEIKSVFHFPEKSVLEPNFAKIYNDINERTDAYELRMGNALWVQQDYPLLTDYMNRVEKYYGGKVANVDFVKETEKSRQTINSFIEKQTNNKIKDLIPKGVIDPSTKLVITNAIYFKGTWLWQFDPKDTREMDFYVSPTNVVKTPMMYMKPDKAKFNYADLGDLQILELPYKGDKISMLILLPKGDLESIESVLTAEKLEEWKNQMQETKLDAIYLPKFELEAKYFMKNILSNLGMPTAFSSDKADFSGMTGNKDLFIKEVIHQAYVEIDEEGTEAAAATGVIINLGLSTNIFKADHPFIFLIQEKETGNILFLGRVIDPNFNPYI